jgi:phage repressor protein C with HTH and peptisase S24 domain/DNA-binding Xre family transcriptional regulator
MEDVPNPQAVRLMQLMEDHGLSLNATAKLAGISESTLRAFRDTSGRSLSLRIADAIGHALAKRTNGPVHMPDVTGLEQHSAVYYHPPADSQASVDISRIAPKDAPYSAKADLPVYASAQAGPTGMALCYEPIEWVKTPAPLLNVKGGFGVYVVNDSMEPKYRQGDMILVHPGKQPRRGDYVLVVLVNGLGEHAAMIKRLVAIDHISVRLEQLNPKEPIDLDRAKVQAVFKVVGSYEGA